MDMQFLGTLLKLLIFFPLVIVLMVFLGRMASKYNISSNIMKNKYMNVMERLSLSKDNSLMVINIGDKYYLVSSCQGRVEILKELDTEEVEKYKVSKNFSMNVDKNSSFDIKTMFFKKK